MKTRTALLTLLILTLALAACAPVPPQAITQPAPTSETVSGGANMANPSATFCEDKGYTYEIRTAGDGSQSGVCKFPDGSECDGWAYYRNECGPAKDKLTPAVLPTSVPEIVANKAVEAARIALAQQLGVSADQVLIESYEQMDWSDACLGLGAANESCAAVITPGFKVRMQVGDKPYIYRTDLTGSVIRQEAGGG